MVAHLMIFGGRGARGSTTKDTQSLCVSEETGEALHLSPFLAIAIAMAILQDLLASIPVYTGLSPVSFFTIAAILIALYYLVSGLFAPPPPPPVRYEPPPPPVQLGDVTEEDLRAYDGTDPSKPLLMAIKGQIYDVSQSRMFYGPGGPYALFAGKDASRALAKMSFEEADLTGNIEGLSAYELDALQDWEWKFMTKYMKVGQIVSNKKDETTDEKEQDDSHKPDSMEPSIKGGDSVNGECESINDEQKVHSETREVSAASEDAHKEQSTENATSE